MLFHCVIHTLFPPEYIVNFYSNKKKIENERWRIMTTSKKKNRKYNENNVMFKRKGKKNI